jgi:hypothetical protein
MATCAVFHMTCDEGSDYSVTFNYNDPITGLPNDLTGYSALMQVRTGMDPFSSYDNVNFVLEFVSDSTSSEYGLILGGTAGTIQVQIPGTKLVNLTWDAGVYDIYLKSPSGSQMKFVRGFFTVIPAATKVNL